MLYEFVCLPPDAAVRHLKQWWQQVNQAISYLKLHQTYKKYKMIVHKIL